MANNGKSVNGRKRNNGGINEDDPAREYLENAARRVTQKDIDQLNTQVPKKLERIDTSLLNEGMEWVHSLVGRATVLFDMMRDKDFKISGKGKTLIAAGLIYFVLPLDMVPDVIPGIGLVDDAFVLTTLWKIIQSEIDSYMAFRGGST